MKRSSATPVAGAASRRATAADVAAAAGVSRSTVSYILNGSGKMTFAPETVAKVQAAASELAYLPNAEARALRRGRSGVVLLALPEVPASANFSKLLATLTDGVRAAGSSLVSLALRPGNGLVEALADLSPSVLLEILPLSKQSLAGVSDVPRLSMWSDLREIEALAAATQVDHLASRGHLSMAVLLPDAASVRTFTDMRLKGVQAAAARRGLPEPDVVWIPGPPEESAAALEQVLPRLHRKQVTGLCCFNDQFAGAAITAARRVDLDVPGDLAVIGIDDDPLSGFLTPALTTIRYDYAELGDAVRSRLAVFNEARATPTSIDHEPFSPDHAIKLRIRSST